MKEKCDICNDWLEYTDTDTDIYGNKCDIYVCINCGKEYFIKIETEGEYD